MGLPLPIYHWVPLLTQQSQAGACITQRQQMLHQFKENLVQVQARMNLNLCGKYYGPYTVLKRVGTVAYQLDLPLRSQIYPVFHISLLKRCVGPTIVPSHQPPISDGDGRVLMQPLAILKCRMVKFNNAVVVKVLVQWTNLSVNEATWEDWVY